MEITDVPVRIPGLDACPTCIAAKMVHLLHKEGHGCVTKYLKRVHVKIAGPMHVLLTGGVLYLYVTVGDYTHMVYAQLLCLRSEVPDAFKAFREAAENVSGKQLSEVMTDNAHDS